MEDPLDAFIEPVDVTKYFSDKLAVPVLDEPPNLRPKNAKFADSDTILNLKSAMSDVMAHYGRGFTQTLCDRNLEVYTERFIARALNTVLMQTCKQYVVIPDYSPNDGRLHFHGALRFEHVKDIAKLRRKLKPFGWTNIKMDPKEGLPDYCMKLYEKNKYTPPNVPIEPLVNKMILVKF